MKKFCESFREHAMKINIFKKKKHEVVNKKTVGIIWKYKNLLHLQRKTWKETCEKFKILPS